MHLPLAIPYSADTHMAPIYTARAEKEKRFNALLNTLRMRLQTPDGVRDADLLKELQKHVDTFPSNTPPAAIATRFDKLESKGAELWNLATRLKRGVGSDGGGVMLEDQLAKPDARFTSEDLTLYSNLSAEYYLLRTAHSWLQGRLDLAEHMFTKASFSDKDLEPRVAENVADTLYEIGKDLLKKKQYELSVKWLERSFAILAGQDLEKLGENAGELRFATASPLEVPSHALTTGLVRALLELKTDAARDRAQDLVALFENVLFPDYGDKLIVQLFKLQLLSLGPEFDAYGYYGACQILDEFLSMRLFSAETEEWIEKALITRLWISTSQAGNLDTLESLNRVVTTLFNNLTAPLSASAAHGAQSDIGAAREAFNKMSDMGKAAPTTRLLMFKVALRSGDAEFGGAQLIPTATECLDIVSANTSEDASLLYACILEAQSTGNKRLAVAALQRVLEKCEHKAPAGVHVPSRILIAEIGSSKVAHVDSVVSLCKLFEGAATQAKTSRKPQAAQPSQLFTIKELDWFSRNSYNTALKSCADWDPRHTLRILQACIKFVDLYPKDMDASTLADLSLRRMFCDFLCVSLLAALARSEDNIEAQLQFYLNLRNHAEAFRKQLQDQLDRLEVDDAKDDLLRKYGTLVAFDLEAAVHLKKWDDLGQIIEGAAVCNNTKVFEPLADAILLSKAPPASKASLFRTDKLARWIRCLFQLALANDLKIAEQLLNQVLTIARDSKIGQTPYPTDELEWLATTTFNRAVDFYCASDDAACKRWAELALSVAQFGNDGGELHGLLQGNYLKMSWEE
ncbi:hypothetical protein FGG08_001094 [Glutinoglossum americanum]|uniref:Protein ZIP4 homolog n=1 Tax=Glutinoglossum americanum TaxID=1670608 RepID=A0A9P8IC30_9PEZI|nr:hypothetical protein FGG08_001094 [Glutinoglossum americanum]